MFEGFDNRGDKLARRRFAASTTGALVLCGLVATGLVALASRPRERARDEVIQVAFRQPEAAKPPPPPVEVKPPPPPPPRPRPRAGAASSNAPAIPTEIPRDELAEGDAADFQRQEAPEAVIGGGMIFDETSARKPPPPPPAPRPAAAKKRTPTILPDGATPPRPLGGNRPPVYPETARKKGVEGMVVLEAVIDERGAVTSLRVREGAEPFASAAMVAVNTWRYEPARLGGEPIAVHRLIRVPFRLKRGA